MNTHAYACILCSGDRVRIEVKEHEGGLAASKKSGSSASMVDLNFMVGLREVSKVSMLSEGALSAVHLCSR